MKLWYVLFFSLIIGTNIYGQRTEKKVERVEKSNRGEKQIIEVFNGDVLIKRQVVEKRVGKNPLTAKYTRYYQEGHEVLFEYWDSRSNEKVRYFTVENRTIAEVDKDNDGLFEWMVFLGPDEKIWSVFKRGRKGQIELLAGKELEEFKQGSELAKTLF